MFLKDPHADLDYAVDWSAACAGVRALVSAEWSVEPAASGGLAIAAQAHDSQRASARLSGGRAGCVYRVGNRALFSDGSRDERSLVIRVEDR